MEIDEVVDEPNKFSDVNEAVGGINRISDWLQQHGQKNLLSDNFVVFFVGKPGCGKTTLSYMLCYASDATIQVCFVWM
jgi:KaiC/GvpD/RAD55 family RecA-like ATPase